MIEARVFSTEGASGALKDRSLTGPGRASLAVLPLTDLSPARDLGHLCEGLADGLLTGLGQVPGVRPLSRTSSFLYAGTGRPLHELGQGLGVDQILAGSLRRVDGRLDVRVELVDVATGRPLWVGHFDPLMEDLPDLVPDVVSALAAALRRPAPAPRHAASPGAYDAFVRARQAYFRFNRLGMRKAADLFKEALAADPGYAPAWAGLAACAAYLFTYVDRSEVHRERAEEASRRALALDPDLAEAHAARGVALSAGGFAEEAEAAFETALRLDPNLYEAAYFYARHCFAAGRMEEAIPFFEWAAATRPEDHQALLLVAQAYDKLGIHDEAERARRQGLALAEARLARVPDDARARYLAANALVALGERDRGLAWARMARDLDPDDSMLLYNLGCIHALADNPTEALACLRQAVKAGLTQVTWFLNDGDLDSLRGLPGFQSLILSLSRA